MGRVAWLVIVGWCVAGCSSSEVVVAHKVPLATATETIPEEELLDVGILVFDSGVPEGEVDKEVLEELIREGTFVHIRRSESIYMSVLLRNTLQKTGNWGSVWITPKETTASDLSVAARIMHSDGADLRLVVTAKDSTGRVWLNKKQYEVSTAAGAFNRQRFPDVDPYQDAFNQIANDLAEEAAQLTGRDLRDVRSVTDLRYAADVSPEAFTGYLAQDRQGVYTLNRLPAAGDPMFDRTQRVRQRERLCLDTLDQHYAQFSTEATQPYNSWREYAREEAIEIRELTKSARFRTIMGAATIAASVIYGQQSDGTFSERILRDALMYVGVDMIRASQVRKQEKRIHTETLEELSTDFDDTIKPMVVEIQGTQHRLTGTADAQYDEWRGLLRQIFITESGFVPEDVSIYTEPEPEAPVELPLVPEPVPEAAPAGEAAPAPQVEATTEAAADANASPSAGT